MKVCVRPCMHLNMRVHSCGSAQQSRRGKGSVGSGQHVPTRLPSPFTPSPFFKTPQNPPLSATSPQTFSSCPQNVFVGCPLPPTSFFLFSFFVLPSFSSFWTFSAFPFFCPTSLSRSRHFPFAPFRTTYIREDFASNGQYFLGERGVKQTISAVKCIKNVINEIEIIR